jgi:hypothetical protein
MCASVMGPCIQHPFSITASILILQAAILDSRALVLDYSPCAFKECGRPPPGLSVGTVPFLVPCSRSTLHASPRGARSSAG